MKFFDPRSTGEACSIDSRMTNLMTFRDKIVTVFSEVMTGIIPDIKDRELFPSETLLLTLASLLDLTISLDTMKNFKGAMSNDLSMYKRAKSMMTKDQLDPEIQVLPKLSFFLASKDQFANDIKACLSSMSNTFESVFVDMINLCADHIENNRFVLPTLKHVYLRAICFAICLIDGEGEDMDYVKKKKFKVDRIGKILKANSVVPLFGDIAVSLGHIISKSPHWNNAKWDLNRNDEETKVDLKRSYLLIHHGNDTKLYFRDTVAQLKRADLFIRKNKGSVSADAAEECYSVVIQSMKALSNFTNLVLEQVLNSVMI